MSLLLPETGLLFWMLLSFSVVFFLLAKFGFPIILKQAEERKVYIDTSLQNAKEANRKLEEVNQTAQKMLRETQFQQQSILREAQESRKKIIEQAKQEAKLVAEQKIKELHSRLEEEQRRSVNALKTEVTNLSVDIAERLLRSQLPDKPSQMKLIERMLDQHSQSTNS